MPVGDIAIKTLVLDLQYDLRVKGQCDIKCKHQAFIEEVYLCYDDHQHDLGVKVSKEAKSFLLWMYWVFILSTVIDYDVAKSYKEGFRSPI